MLSIDLIGKLPRSENFAYMLSIVDIATKFIVPYLLRQATTTEIVKRMT